MPRLSAQAVETLREMKRRVFRSGSDIRFRRGAAEPYRYHELWFRVESNEGDGEYTLWRQKWNATSHEYEDVTSPLTPEQDAYEAETAWEMRGSSSTAVDTLVHGWFVYVQTDPDVPGEYILVFEAPSRVLWGVATSNWVNPAITLDSADFPAVPYVPVNPCEDREGANPDTLTTHTVYLPRCGDRYVSGTGAHWEMGWDPNICEGDVIAYEITEDATHVCVSGYLQPKIGSAMWWVLGSDEYGTVDAELIPPGWRICDDTSVEGSTDLDARGYFPVVWHSETGKELNAADTDNYYIHIGDTGGFDLHGIDENGHPDHDPHVHCVPACCGVETQTGTGDTFYFVGPATSPAWVQTTTPKATCPYGTSGDDQWLRHGGTQLDGLHAWTPTGDEAHPKNDTDNRPEYIVLVLMERYDNSA